MVETRTTSPGERLVLLGTLGAVAIVLTAGGSWLLAELGHGRRRPSNDTAAMGALKAIGTSQLLVAERRRAAGGPGRVAASLAELSGAGLIDEVLGSGTKQGYLFRLQTTPDGLDWMATASPVIPGTTGERWLAITSDLRLFHANAPIPLAPGARLPPHAHQVGGPRAGAASSSR